MYKEYLCIYKLVRVQYFTLYFNVEAVLAELNIVCKYGSNYMMQTC